MTTLKGKTALVTGGGGGIGRGIAEAFGSHGAQVVVAELKEERADAVRATLEAAKVDNMVVKADVRVQSEVTQLLGEIEKRYGKLDILVNNVGTASTPKRFEETTDEDWDFEYQINLRHMFVVTRAAIPLIRKSGAGGSIINLSSIEAFRGIPLLTVYGAFKSAVIGFTQSLALELGHEGIRVNAIAPETTESEVITPSKWIRPEDRGAIASAIPLGRFGTPGDAAGCAVFLASELSAWVTGTTIHLDGGALAAAGWHRLDNGAWTNAPVISKGALRLGRGSRTESAR
ncbi:MAG TPA: SDR family NAD(P)-dependent oxidoreductase [Candidatus Binataceae bacterium]|nr:SDR family NAD(P)-dependent oxidoreductase [Candidatus Binataceae bacterium]